MTIKINKLTPEQEALIPVHQDKWRAIALSTERIDRTVATEAIKAVYAAIAQPVPEVIFCESPSAVPQVLTRLLQQQFSPDLAWVVERYSSEQRQAKSRSRLGNSLTRQLEEQLHWAVRRQVEEQLSWQVRSQLESQPWPESYELQLWEQLQLTPHLQDYWHDGLRLETWMRDAVWLDLAISVLSSSPDRRKWLAFQMLIEECGWLLPYENVCIVCDRPVSLNFDDLGRLHAEGEPAIAFADGFQVYAYQGVRLPEQYGQLPPDLWRSQWLLEEFNFELRQVLLQGIGYERISQELEAIAIDTWREYILLGVDAEIDDEPMLLLKMTCPSTGLTHVARVPPDFDSAQEAIQWVNWDIDPAEFAVQT
jgi:hypothetical protein